MRNKKQLMALLSQGKLDDIKALAARERGIATTLVGFLYNPDPLIHWRAADAIGRCCSVLLSSRRASVENLLPRLTWAMNDESGTVGWAVPQAIGEIVRNDEKLASDYAPLLVSYLDDEDVAVETAQLEQGVLYALSRIGERYPSLIRQTAAAAALNVRLKSSEPTVRALAIRCLVLANPNAVFPEAVHDEEEAMLYQSEQLVSVRVRSVVPDA